MRLPIFDPARTVFNAFQNILVPNPHRLGYRMYDVLHSAFSVPLHCSDEKFQEMSVQLLLNLLRWVQDYNKLLVW